MRLNKFIASATGLSRRAADRAISEGRVQINQQPATLGSIASEHDTVTLDNRPITLPVNTMTIMMNKPTGYVCSRDGQGSRTIYDLLPPELHHLKPVGRLDKYSSGLLLMTDDGIRAHQLTHPSFEKEKIYEIELNKPLTPQDKAKIEKGVELEDGLSRLHVSEGERLEVRGSRARTSTSNLSPTTYRVTMSEGRNRQIRRTFDALGYEVTRLHRTVFGSFRLGTLPLSTFIDVA